MAGFLPRFSYFCLVWFSFSCFPHNQPMFWQLVKSFSKACLNSLSNDCLCRHRCDQYLFRRPIYHGNVTEDVQLGISSEFIAAVLLLSIDVFPLTWFLIDRVTLSRYSTGSTVLSSSVVSSRSFWLKRTSCLHSAFLSCVASVFCESSKSQSQSIIISLVSAWCTHSRHFFLF